MHKYVVMWDVEVLGDKYSSRTRYQEFTTMVGATLVYNSLLKPDPDSLLQYSNITLLEKVTRDEATCKHTYEAGRCTGCGKQQ